MLCHDYSASERALCFGGTLTLAILAVTSLGLRYVTSPVHCWTPAQLTDAMVDYTHDICFHKTEIFNIEGPAQHLQQYPFRYPPPLQHTYHQWVPFALGVGAILCLVPHFLWRMLSGPFLWMDAHALAQTLADNQRHHAASERHVVLKDSALLLQAGLRGGNWGLTAAAVLRKGLVLLVCVLQMVLAMMLFKPKLIVDGDDDDDEKEKSDDEEEEEEEERDYNASIPLPKQFFCDVSVRLLQRVEVYTVQCTNPLAQVYSKGFTFLFYLFLLLALLAVLDLMAVLCRLALPPLRDSALRRYLAISEAHAPPDSPLLLRRFLDSLGVDGRLVMGVVAEVCGPLAAADLTHHLWMTFRASGRPVAVGGGGPGEGGPHPHPPHPGTVVSTVPSAASAPPPSSTGNAEAIPLLPLSTQGQQGKGAEA